MVYDTTAIVRNMEEKLAAAVDILDGFSMKPGIAVLVIGDNNVAELNAVKAAAEKVGVTFTSTCVDAMESFRSIKRIITHWNMDDGIHAIMVLGQPACIDKELIYDLIREDKDVAVQRNENIGRTIENTQEVSPPAVKAVSRIVRYIMAHPDMGEDELTDVQFFGAGVPYEVCSSIAEKFTAPITVDRFGTIKNVVTDVFLYGDILDGPTAIEANTLIDLKGAGEAEKFEDAESIAHVVPYDDYLAVEAMSVIFNTIVLITIHGRKPNYIPMRSIEQDEIWDAILVQWD